MKMSVTPILTLQLLFYVSGQLIAQLLDTAPIKEEKKKKTEICSQKCGGIFLEGPHWEAEAGGSL